MHLFEVVRLSLQWHRRFRESCAICEARVRWKALGLTRDALASDAYCGAAKLLRKPSERRT